MMMHVDTDATKSRACTRQTDCTFVSRRFKTILHTQPQATEAMDNTDDFRDTVMHGDVAVV